MEGTGTLIDFSNLMQVLEEYQHIVVERYKMNITEDGHVASGKLINNVTYILGHDDRAVEVSLNLQDYWKYVEKGTRPHWPPLDEILNWIQVKKILPTKTYDGKLPTEKQLAYLISRKISEKGTEGTNDLKKTLEEVNREFEFKIGEAIAKDVEGIATAILTELQVRP